MFWIKLDLLWLLSCITAGIKGEWLSTGSSENVFGEHGRSVQLDVKKDGLQFDEISWMFSNQNVLKYYSHDKSVKCYHPYEGRVEFNSETYSLTLKNLQKNDSGLYKAKASGQTEVIVAEYILNVIDPVEQPKLTYQQNNCTFTCRGHGLSINTSCYKTNCETKNETSDQITLFLSAQGSSIICNLTNPVSSKHTEIDMKTLKDFGEKENRNAASDPCPRFLWPVLSAVMIIDILSVF